MLYRVLNPLSRKGRFYPIGTVTDLSWVNEEGREKLIHVGAVAEVHGPPITELPDWKTRAPRLAKQDIINLDQLVTADASALAAGLKISVTTVERWQSEAAAALVAPSEPQC